MLDTRTTMKGKYKQYSCPHCSEGVNEGILESPQHLMRCQDYQVLRIGINPEESQQDQPTYLRNVISMRKEQESKLGNR